jgi:hypothetical protein
MPCYGDIPDESDQEEIERRCKIRMYFDAQGLLTKEQAQEKANLNVFPLENINEQLCKMCKILTKEQMKKISAYQYQIKWSHKTLYDWHVQHCKDDEEFNK